MSPRTRSTSATPSRTVGAVATAALSDTSTLISTCGSVVITEARSASERPVCDIRPMTSSAVSTPSPVVPWRGTTTCPLCSPPRAKPPARNSSRT